MNCDNFESLIVDIARGQLMGASLREEATLHTHACQACAARLAREQNLSVALKALALLDENKKASHQVDAHLLATFRNRSKADSIPAAVLSAPRETAPRNHRAYWWAAAAVILIALSLLALRLPSPKPALPEAQGKAVQPQPPEPQNPQNKGVKENDKVAPRDPSPVASRVGSKRRNPVQQTARLTSQPPKPAPSQQAASANSKPLDEIATNFIPLYDIPMTEGGQVVRVELPRSALSTFGLPVNAKLADKPIKADVVIGNDGIARAIRFVQ